MPPDEPHVPGQRTKVFTGYDQRVLEPPLNPLTVLHQRWTKKEQPHEQSLVSQQRMTSKDVQPTIWVCHGCLVRLSHGEIGSSDQAYWRSCLFATPPHQSPFSSEPAAKSCTACIDEMTSCCAPLGASKHKLYSLNEVLPRVLFNTDFKNQRQAMEDDFRADVGYSAQPLRPSAHDNEGLLKGKVVRLAKSILNDIDRAAEKNGNEKLSLHSGAIKLDENPDSGVWAPLCH